MIGTVLPATSTYATGRGRDMRFRVKFQFSEYALYKAFLFGKLPANTGMLFENMVAQELTARGHELLFLEFKHGDSKRNYEPGFDIYVGIGIPIESEFSDHKENVMFPVRES